VTPLRIDEARGGRARLTIVLAPGAGAGLDSPFLEQVARALASGGLRVVRFDFPYMRAARAAGRRTARPDAPAVLEQTWLQVIGELGEPSRLVIGGKSMGGRIASMVADRAGVKGLVCLGYPFHPTGRPGILRVAHLEKLATPALILQGERDAFGSREEIAAYTLSPAIRLAFLPDGDHSFKPRKGSGRSAEENLAQAVREIASFCAGL
jgi:predicted alpha/beta-hydrolase family hydrolase